MICFTLFSIMLQNLSGHFSKLRILMLFVCFFCLWMDVTLMTDNILERNREFGFES